MKRARPATSDTVRERPTRHLPVNGLDDRQPMTPGPERDAAFVPAGGRLSGYCECGCGQRTKLAPQSDKRRGWIRGEPLRFVTGHNTRVKQNAPPAVRGEGVDYIIDPETGCWVWQRYVMATGYGRMRHEGRLTLAHRFYYEQAHGPVPPGRQLDHLCRNRSCVNPDHLEPVTNAENKRRGNGVKLTAQDAREIYVSTESPQRLIAERYGVSLNTVEHIKAGKLWKDVTGAQG